MFTIIEGGLAVTKSKGIFRQVKLYERGQRIYCQWGNGFISLHKGAGDKIVTSIPDVQIDEYTLEYIPRFTATGAMVTHEFRVLSPKMADEVNKELFGERAGKRR